MSRKGSFLIAAIGVATFVLFRSWRRYSHQRLALDRERQREDRYRWEGEGGSPAPERPPEAFSPTL